MSPAANKNAGLSGLFGENATIRRVRTAAQMEDCPVNTASYAGIINKTGFFMLVTLLGILLYFFMENIFLRMAGGYEIRQVLKDGVLVMQTTRAGALCVGAAAIIAAAAALISVFVRTAIPVAGTCYMLAEGYVLASMNNALVDAYKWIGILALILTVTLVFVLMVLYRTGAVHFSGKARRIISAVFLTIAGASLIMFVCQFIPGLNTLAAVYNRIMANPVISLIFSIFYIVSACLFLISDFESVRIIVETGADARYEWSCAFGIAYSVLYLYLKIFRLLVRLVGKSKKSNS